MAISDVLIELLTFTKDELYALGKAREVSLPRGGDKFDVAEALSQHITLTELREVAGESLGAGRTSLSWVALVPEVDDVAPDGDAAEAAQQAAEDAEEPIEAETPLTSDPVALESVTEALQALTGQTRPFSANLRPSDVTSEPTLINAQYDGDDLVLFTLAYAVSPRLSIRLFQVNRRAEDRFFHVVLRLSRGVLEIRADARTAKKVTRGWIAELAEALDRQPLRIHLSDRDARDVADRLEARFDKHDARHEDEEVGYARTTVTASTKYPDLRQSPRFEEDFKDSDPIASDLVFDWQNRDGEFEEIRIKVSPRAGTIQCVSHVSNEVMELVYDTLRESRAAR